MDDETKVILSEIRDTLRGMPKQERDWIEEIRGQYAKSNERNARTTRHWALILWALAIIVVVLEIGRAVGDVGSRMSSW